MVLFLNKKFGKIFKIVLVLALIGIGVNLLQQRYITESSAYKDYLQSYIGTDSDATSTENSVTLKSFYNGVFQSLMDNAIPGEASETFGEECKLDGDVGYRAHDDEKWSSLTLKNLANCLKIEDSDFQNLKTSHKSFTDDISKLSMPKNSYQGDGIVIVGGGKYSVMALQVIKALRKFGTTLPVEVFIPPTDIGDTAFCNALESTYNAKCIYINRILPDEMIENFTFKGYQFKSLAIITSTFKNILLLDADNFPVKKLDGIFKEEPFVSTGLVTWPDFWRHTTQPLFYDIAGMNINMKNRVRNADDDITPPVVYTKDFKDLEDVPLHDFDGTIPDPSTESGEMIFNKDKHLNTILLSLYYNVNGPTWYYPIFSQKAAGAGDKDTFLAAATYYNLPFYQVRSRVGVDGYHKSEDDSFRGVAMLQHDFVHDYQQYLLAKSEITEKYSGKNAKFDPNYSSEAIHDHYFKETSVLFIHAHLPKFDPVILAKDNDLIENGHHIRMYRNCHKFQFDIELENFELMKDVICDNPLGFKYIEKQLTKGTVTKEKMCQYISDRVNFLQSTHNDAMAGTLH